MAWIASDQKNRDHPKLIRAARALGISKVTMIGHMHLLWYWALDYAQDGELSAFDAVDIAEAAEWAGDPDLFIAALVESARIGDKPGLLEYVNGILMIHDWHDYAGKLIERRREDAERKRASRGIDVRKTSNGHPADIHKPSDVEYSTVQYTTEPNKDSGKGEEMALPPPLASESATFARAQSSRLAKLNAQVGPALRIPLANAVLDITGKRALADAGGPESERLLLAAHEAAVTLWQMGKRSESDLLALEPEWRDDWRGVKGGTITQFLEFVSECQGGKASKQATPKAGRNGRESYPQTEAERKAKYIPAGYEDIIEH